MKIFFSCALAFLSSHFLLSQSIYHYNLDLKNVSNDMVKVVLTPPKMGKDQATFIMPKLVPGSYAVENFGRFLKDFAAYDADGKNLKVKQVRKNQFVISDATNLAKIEYWVTDTWDDKNLKQFIFQPGGSNIEQNSNFVVNPHCFFGYFDGYKMLPYEIEVQKPEGFYGATHLEKKEETSSRDVLSTSNYVELADNPVMYCKPDTTSFDIGNMNVMIAVYSANGKVQSKAVCDYLKPMGHALKRFFNYLPVNQYLFIYYFDDPARLRHSKGAGLSSGGYGALEHHHCSFYYLPETNFEPELKSSVCNASSHEFLHILTPLNVHSKEIEDFDFLDPKMSEHLWMYEGVTEYFSILCQMQDSVFSEKDFLRQVRSKINQADKYGNFSFTAMSRNVLTQQNQKLYLSVYNRGAVLAMMLDLEIITLTGGQKNLKTVMLELAKKYGPSRPFKDEELISEFVALVHADLKKFFDDYVTGSEKFDYGKFFGRIGWDYVGEKERNIYLSGYFGLKFDEVSRQFILTNVSDNIFGFKNGDALLSVNGEQLDMQNVTDIFEKYFKLNSSPAQLEVSIMRNKLRSTVKGKPVEAVAMQKNYLAKRSDITPQEEKIRKVFFGL